MEFIEGGAPSIAARPAEDTVKCFAKEGSFLSLQEKMPPPLHFGMYYLNRQIIFSSKNFTTLIL